MCGTVQPGTPSMVSTPAGLYHMWHPLWELCCTSRHILCSSPSGTLAARGAQRCNIQHRSWTGWSGCLVLFSPGVVEGGHYEQSGSCSGCCVWHSPAVADITCSVTSTLEGLGSVLHAHGFPVLHAALVSAALVPKDCTTCLPVERSCGVTEVGVAWVPGSANRTGLACAVSHVGLV